MGHGAKTLRDLFWFATGLLAATAAFLFLEPQLRDAARTGTTLVETRAPQIRDALEAGRARIAGTPEPAAPAGPPPQPPVAVDLARVAAGRAEDAFATTGRIVAAETVTLAAEVRGRVAEIAVTDGQPVKRGDLVLRFDTTAEELGVRGAQARLDEARRNFERQQQLVRRNVAAEVTLEQARSALEIAQAEVAAAEFRLGNRVVTAPFDGRIDFVRVSPGALLEPGAAIATLVTEEVRVRFDLPERIALQVEAGTEVRLHLADDQVARGTVAVLSPIADPQTQSVTMEARFAEDARLRPGSFARVDVVLEEREALFVPETAVQRQGRAAWIFAARDGRAVRIPVETGSRSDGWIEVRAEDLRADEAVVAAGLHAIRDGAPLAPRGEAAVRVASTP